MIGGPSNQKIEQDIRDNKIKEGMLLKQSRHLKQWKDRWMVLTKSYLYSFQSRAVYKNPTEVIMLSDVETTKAYYKDQYKPYTFRVQSKDVNLHIAAKTQDEKWAWMTAIQKMIQRVLHPDSKPDTHNLIRQTIRMSTAVRNTLMKKQQIKEKINAENSIDDVMKKFKFTLESNVTKYIFQPVEKSRRMTLQSQTFFKIVKTQKSQKKIEQGQTIPTNNVEEKKEKIVEKIVEVPVEKIVYKQIKVPEIKEVIVEKIVQKIIEKPIYIQKQMPKNDNNKKSLNSQSLENSNIEKILTHLLQSPHENPRAIMDFAVYLLTEGPEQYHEPILNFTLKGSQKRLFSEYLILLINQEIAQNKLNSYLRFVILLFENTQEQYFYTSDFKCFIDILLRQMEMNKSQFNQYLIMMSLKTMAEKDWWLSKNYRRGDIKALVKQLETIGNSQNQFLASQLLSKI